ncbi:TPM domain-containing protein [Paucibacter sp. B51]|uniref:TPM domain-containing protein n=1 Tax=Paucibacter sp. B51 TaxID=2993315 RepID=UPI0022EBA6B7|nr:TPM domain-containing protein [Paucibacter sp. B51]
MNAGSTSKTRKQGWLRWWRHRWMDSRDAERALPDAALARIEAQVRASEARHQGQICVCVEAGLPTSYLWKGLQARDRAITLFGKLRVWDTEANNGVLIYLLLADRAIEVVADRGLKPCVSPQQWQALVASLGEALKAGQFEPGLAAAVNGVSELLCEHFPLREGETARNELPDAVLRL